MKKYIQVILNNSQPQKIEKVSRGYAFNYLIPKKIAEIATKSKIEQINLQNDLSDKKKDKFQQKNLKINRIINNIKIIHIRKKCGSNYQIFGSVTEQEIQVLISKIIKHRIDKKQIIIDQVKQIGVYLCKIIINETMKASIEIHILPNNT
uniref:50S ribosomal protein L9, chloroplastic n=1 Tax=Porolithon onkodes TaxID=231751 RepID=A0A2Z2KS10_9FLOR|nr:ribosomal protein L9 [Porolithon onkodes]ASB29676.1 ribosomal protein L9 [Porolithon onkodes]